MNLKNIFKHPLTILFFTVLALFFSYSLNKTAQKSKVSQKNLDVLDQKVSNLASEIEEEQYQLQLARTPLAKEKIIRNELLLQKPGEYILQIPEENRENTELPVSQMPPQEQWLKLFTEN